ncbi:MAG: cytochrome d ubiquinol oxidase subunit II, partial [Salegentibacter sp.]
AHFPDIIIARETELSLLEGIAPEATINSLGIALIIGGAVILPGLYHLMRSFRMIKIFEK